MKRDNGADRPTAVPVLVCGALSAQAAAYVVTYSMDDRHFSVLVHVALLLGFAAAYWARRSAFPAGLVSSGVFVLALAAFVMRHTGASFVAPLFPEGGSDPNLALANLLVWFLVAFSFQQARRRQMIFVTTTGLALFGLIGVINLEASFLVAFAVFAFATIVAWSYDGLAVRAGSSLEADWQRALMTQAVGAAPVLAISALVGFLLSLALFTYVPNPFVATGLAFRPLFTWAGNLVQGTFLPLSHLAVGTGPAPLGDEVLFWVRFEHTGLWRMSCFDHYDDYTTWERTGSTRAVLTRLGTQRAQGDSETFTLPPPEGPGRRLNQQEFWLRSGSTGTLLGADKPIEIRITPLIGSLPTSILSVDNYGEMTLSQVIPPSTVYTVTSAMTDWPARDLRRASTNYTPEDRQRYIEDVPLRVQTALQPLVDQITAGLTNPYDKAWALQRYLEENCFYTDQEPATPPGEDAVVYFMLNTRRGACDVFASSLAMMLRLAGIPSRLATGFITGPADVDDPRWYDIRAKDAHAWVEVYFPGYDWIPFNPQPDRELEKQPLLSLLRSGQAAYVAGQMARRLGALLAIVVAAALVLSGVADPRLLRLRWRSFREGWDPWERAARASYRATGTALTAAGLRATPGETPGERLERVAAAPGERPPALAQLQTLTAEFYEARFGPEPTSPRRAAQLAREFRRLRKRLRRRRR